MRLKGVHASQLVQSMEQPGFHSSHRTAQRRGYSHKRIIHVKAQVNDLLMFCRKRLHAVSHQGGLFAKLDCLIGRSITIGQVVHAVLDFPPVVPRQRGKRHGAVCPDGIAVTVEEDRTEPGEKLASTVVTTQALPSLDQRVLSQIFGQSGVATEREGLSQQTRFINPAHLAVRFRIARLRTLKETARVWDFGLHNRWSQAEHISIVAQNAEQSIQAMADTHRAILWRMILPGPGPP